MNRLIKKIAENSNTIIDAIKKLPERDKNQLINKVEEDANDWIEGMITTGDYEVENGKVTDIPDVNYYTDRYFDDKIIGDPSYTKDLLSETFGDDFYDEINLASDSDLKEFAGYIRDIAYDQVSESISDYVDEFSKQIEESYDDSDY